MAESKEPAGPVEQAKIIYNAICFYKGGKEMFSELVEFMDGDRDNDLLQHMKEIDQKNFPEKYNQKWTDDGEWICQSCKESFPYKPIRQCSSCDAFLCVSCAGEEDGKCEGCFEALDDKDKEYEE